MIPVNVVATNRQGITMNLTPEDHSILTEFTGEQPIKANLTSQGLYNRDGAVFQSSKGATRNIVFTVYIFKDVSTNKNQLYNVFVSGEYVDLVFTVDGYTRSISGVVESFEYKRYVKSNMAMQAVQISVMCFEPYFMGEEKTVDFTGTGTSFAYNGNVDASPVIEMSFETAMIEEPIQSYIELSLHFTPQINRDKDSSLQIRLEIEPDFAMWQVFNRIVIDSQNHIARIYFPVAGREGWRDLMAGYKGGRWPYIPANDTVNVLVSLYQEATTKTALTKTTQIKYNEMFSAL